MKHTVLIAEQSPTVAQLLEDAFTQVGCRVVGVCSNGLSAVRRAKELRPNIVALDVNLPVMSGAETAAVLKQQNLGLSIFAIGSRRRARTCDGVADAVLSRPRSQRNVSALSASIHDRLLALATSDV